MENRNLSVTFFNIKLYCEGLASRFTESEEEEPSSSNKQSVEYIVTQCLLTQLDVFFPTSLIYIVEYSDDYLVFEIVDILLNIDVGLIFNPGTRHQINDALKDEGLEISFSTLSLEKLIRNVKISPDAYRERKSFGNVKQDKSVPKSIGDQMVKKEEPTDKPTSFIEIKREDSTETGAEGNTEKRGTYQLRANGMAANIIAVGETLTCIPSSLFEAFKQSLIGLRSYITGATGGSIILTLMSENEQFSQKALSSLCSGKILKNVNEMLCKIDDTPLDSLELLSFQYIRLDQQQWKQNVEHSEKIIQTYRTLSLPKPELHMKNEEDTVLNENTMLKQSEEQPISVKKAAVTKSMKRKAKFLLKSAQRPKKRASISKSARQKSPANPSDKINLRKVFEDTDLKLLKETAQDVDLYEALEEKYQLGTILRDAPFLVNYYLVLLRVKRYKEASEITNQLLKLFKKNLQLVTTDEIQHFADSKARQNKIYEAILFYYIAAQSEEATAVKIIKAIEAISSKTVVMMEKQNYLEKFAKQFVVPLMQTVSNKLCDCSFDHPSEKCLAVVSSMISIAKVQSRLTDSNEEETLLDAIDIMKQDLKEEAEKHKIFGTCYEMLGVMYRKELRTAEGNKFLEKAEQVHNKTTDHENSTEKLFKIRIGPTVENPGYS